MRAGHAFDLFDRMDIEVKFGETFVLPDEFTIRTCLRQSTRKALGYVSLHIEIYRYIYSSLF